MRHLFFMATALFGLISACPLHAQTNYQLANHQKISNGNGNLGSLNSVGDRFGDAVANIGDLDHDGVNDLAVGADYNDANGTDLGQVYILFMKQDKTVKSISAPIYLTGGNRFGLRLAPMGDLDGDGNPDLAIGSIKEGAYTGAVYICLLNADGTVKSNTKIDNMDIPALSIGGAFGHEIANIGDINGDGITDIMVAAPFENSYKGAVYIITLNSSFDYASHTHIADGAGGIPSSTLSANGEFGMGMAAIGDLNGDGYNDYMVSAPFESSGMYATCGGVWVLFMNSSGLVGSLHHLNAGNPSVASFLDNQTHFGMSIERLENLTLNTGATVALGAYNPAGSTTNAGALYLLEMNSIGDVASFVIVNNSSGGWSAPLSNDDRFGISIAGMGFTYHNNKPVYRLAIGAAFANDGGTDAGAVYMLDMQDVSCQGNTPEMTGYQLIANGSGGLGSSFITSNDRFGDGVANVGDIDHDGVNDLAVGADYYGTSDEGAVHILFMNRDKTVKSTKTITITNSSRAGLRVCGMGDINGDGNPDIAVGAVGNDNYTGAVYICLLDQAGNILTGSSPFKLYNSNMGLSNGELFGEDVANIGDIDGNGVNDLLVGAPYTSTQTGAAYIVKLGYNSAGTTATLVGSTKIANNMAGLGATAIASGSQFGSGVSSLGDLNGDGYTDLIITAAFDNSGYSWAGAAYVLFMNSAYNTVTSLVKLHNGNGLSGLVGANTNFGVDVEYLKGFTIGTGATVAISAYNPVGQSAQTGAVHFLELNTSGNVVSAMTIDNSNSAWATAPATGDKFGVSLSAMDHISEGSKSVYRLAVGASYTDASTSNTDYGAVYMIDLADASCCPNCSRPLEVSGIMDQPAQPRLAEMNIYPNPATQSVHIAVPTTDSRQQNFIQITDMQGKTMIVPASWVMNGSNSASTLDISRLRPGIYTISVQAKDTIYRGTVVKQ